MSFDLNSMQTFDFSKIKSEQIDYKDKKTGIIYCLKIVDRIKFGRSKNFDKRFREYQRIVPDVRIIAKKNIADYYNEEVKLCRKFGCVCGTNEWEDYTEDIEAEVIEYFKCL